MSNGKNSWRRRRRRLLRNCASCPAPHLSPACGRCQNKTAKYCFSAGGYSGLLPLTSYLGCYLLSSDGSRQSAVERNLIEFYFSFWSGIRVTPLWPPPAVFIFAPPRVLFSTCCPLRFQLLIQSKLCILHNYNIWLLLMTARHIQPAAAAAAAKNNKKRNLKTTGPRPVFLVQALFLLPFIYLLLELAWPGLVGLLLLLLLLVSSSCQVLQFPSSQFPVLSSQFPVALPRLLISTYRKKFKLLGRFRPSD